MKLREENGAQTVRGGRDGFTMLEIMLAMSLLVIIMLILTAVFDQSASTWESGMRETDRALEGRTVLSSIAAELELAVMNDGIYANLPAQSLAEGSTISFYRYTDVPDEDVRALIFVTYKGGGKVTRREQRVEVGSPYKLGYPSDEELLDNVQSFNVEVPPGGPYNSQTLPRWVDIELELTESAKAVSGVGVVSAGPDGAFNTKDDISE